MLLLLQAYYLNWGIIMMWQNELWDDHWRKTHLRFVILKPWKWNSHTLIQLSARRGTNSSNPNCFRIFGFFFTVSTYFCHTLIAVRLKIHFSVSGSFSLLLWLQYRLHCSCRSPLWCDIEKYSIFLTAELRISRVSEAAEQSWCKTL